MLKNHFLVLCLCSALLLSGCGKTHPPAESQPTAEPTTANELRGVWLSYLELDGLLAGADEATVKRRLNEVMDTCVAQGMNTVFFHVRAHSDAYYPSQVYPAATTAASLLDAGFDPLAYAVEAAHERGLAIHAWINPYRIGSNAPPEAENVFLQDGMYYYNPAAEAARARVLDGVRELLSGYAINGIHFDDYFYPAGLNAKQAEAFETVPEGITVGDYRRAQVNGLISAVWSLCQQEDRVFGVSPMALPEKCRATAYADVALWMRQRGYIDYICPQIYYGFDHGSIPYASTLEKWTAMPRREDIALYVGLALYKAGLEEDPYAGDGKAEWAKNHNILARQVETARNTGRVSGFVLFRYDYMLKSGAAAKEMQALQALLK